ncbi:restriction endonuclease PLD domain-containing protein [Mammaliicoccus sciuri]|uniref:restriction endonuclease PLD domain-containing protein n=1 Tax=Mammaliicoccus sciuri TaxID=1296 RepID=UPI001FB3FAE9|nr:restriction endonuclease PLD domain-containing protein [Mammaliicoccus sciuri]MCJ1785275.1 NgoFVII family restriction endonuclease [Mammaliicoccus sciuri]
MLYYIGLEEIVFNKQDLLSEEPDEFIVISGFLGPAPVMRASTMKNINVTIIGGMYSKGIDIRLLDALNRVSSNSENLKVYFTSKEIHSKIYVWKKNGKTLSALIGSANFSSNGLRTDYRESLADATRDTFKELDRYITFIMDNSLSTPKINNKQKEIDYSLNNVTSRSIDNIKITAEIPLYDEKKGEVPSYSGLNWGRAQENGAHTADGDAYIRIPKLVIKENIGLIKPFDPTFITPAGKRKRNSDPIEIVWDDGYVMEASLEGVQKHEELLYPKQLASYSSKTPILDGKRISKKSILGRYIRKRLGVGISEEITKATLDTYGRNTITLSLLEEGIYYADFSVSEKQEDKD